MSSALAIAGVSAVLRDLLNDGIINNQVDGVIGSTVTVTTLPPDRVTTGEGVEASQLNLFLLRVTPNLGWRNEGLPSRNGSGNRLSNPPLALNLHYLISAYGAAPLHAEILLGYAMQLLHENPVISRADVRTALQFLPDESHVLPPAERALADSGLGDQVEQLKITPEYLDSEELSKLWTACQARYRPCAGYQVSVVLIQATEPAPSPLPVLSRNVSAQPNLLPPPPPFPTLDGITPDGGQPVALLGTTIRLAGHHLDGTQQGVRLTNERFQIDQPLPAEAGGSESTMQFIIPTAQAADFPVGVYSVNAHLQLVGETQLRETNQLAMTLAPQITGLPMIVTRSGGTANITIQVLPALRQGQAASLLLGTQEFAASAFVQFATELSFVIPNAPIGNFLVRLRVDGIDSPIIDRVAKVPAFLNQRIEIK